jgi:integrase
MIKKAKNGKHKDEYQVRIQPIDKITGKRINWPVMYAATKKEAVKIEREMWAEYESGLNPKDGKVVFADDFERYVKLRSKSISKVTLKSWQETVKSVKSYFGKAKIDQISTAMISQYAHDYIKIHHATVSNTSSISKRLTHLRNYFKTLEGKAIKINPVPENALKLFFKQSDFSISQEWRIFTTEELDKIRKLIIHDLKCNPVEMNGSKLAILIDSYTGMRVGELQALKFSNMIKEDNFWTFKIDDSWSDLSKSFNGSLKARPKGYSRTLLPVPKELIELIKEYQTLQEKFLKKHELANPTKLMFVNLRDYRRAKNCEPLTQSGLTCAFKDICKNLEIDSNGKRLSLYSFRHTICTKLANTPGISYPWAAKKMGHTVSRFMKTYVGVDPDINSRMSEIWTA